MNIIAVDDERRALAELEDAIREAVGGAELSCFSTVQEALGYAREHRVDVAFLDVEIHGVNGLLLAKSLKDIYSDTNIVFVTGFNRYMGDALDMYVSGYVMKPISPNRVARELENLRSPIRQPDTGVRVQCFGSFEVFVGDEPVPFRRAKAKETLAYLVDRQGASVSNKEIAAVLWEDEPYNRNKQKQLDTIIIDMLHSLDAAGIRDMITKSRGAYAVDVSKFSCDYYLYEQGSLSAVHHYHGKYMENYSWAEFTAARLTTKDK